MTVIGRALVPVGIVALVGLVSGQQSPTTHRSAAAAKRPVPAWVRDARAMLAQLEKYQAEAKPHLWAWQFDHETAKGWDRQRREKRYNALDRLREIGRRVYDLTWRLWLTTGHHPFDAIGDASNNYVMYLPRLIDDYREALRERAELTEAQAQFRGVQDAAALLARDCWMPAVLYLEEKIDFQKTLGGEHPLYCPGKLPKTLGKEAKTAYESWIARNLSPRHWRAEKKRFCSDSGDKFDNKALRAIWHAQLLKRPAEHTIPGPESRPSAAEKPMGG